MFDRIERTLFSALFFALLLLPLMFINRKEGAVSDAENRALAAPAKFYKQDGKSNTDYLK